MSRKPCPAHLTREEAGRLLREHGLAPRKRDGQHFLVDPGTVDRIVGAAGLAPGDVVLEIGPGLGSLTGALVAAARRVVAIEIDSGFVEVLRERLSGCDGLEIVHADALEVDLSQLLGGDEARLVANLPYNLATPMVIEALLSPAVDDALVMVQREVGERWTAGVGDDSYGAVSVKLDLLADVEVAFAVPRGVFLPAPRVDSVMVRLTRAVDAPPVAHTAAVHDLIDVAFAHRRKTLRNNLLALGPAARIGQALSRAGIDARRRAETLDAEAFLRLFTALEELDAEP